MLSLIPTWVGLREPSIAKQCCIHFTTYCVCDILRQPLGHGTSPFCRSLWVNFTFHISLLLATMLSWRQNTSSMPPSLALVQSARWPLQVGHPSRLPQRRHAGLRVTKGNDQKQQAALHFLTEDLLQVLIRSTTTDWREVGVQVVPVVTTVVAHSSHCA